MAINPTISIRVDSAGLVTGNPSYFDVSITASSDTAAFALGSVDGWCIDREAALTVGNSFTNVKIYSSYETGILLANSHFAGLGDVDAVTPANVPFDNAHPSNPYLENLDIINWLINNVQISSSTYTATVRETAIGGGNHVVVLPYYTITGMSGLYTYGDIQQSMWELLGDGVSTTDTFLGPYSTSRITDIVNEGVNHAGFVPHTGDKLAVVLDLGASRQPVIITTQAAALGDYVWNDVNHNGLQDDGNTGIDGATVLLGRDLNNDGDIGDTNELIATTTTGDNANVAGTQHGYYEFLGLTPGLDYKVQFVMPTGYDSVSPRQSDHVTGSGNNSDALLSNTVVLKPGEFNSTIDAGFYKTIVPASLGDRLWVDTNHDGIQNDGATGIVGATVTLIGGGADGFIDGVNDTTATTITGSDGFYQFTGLTPGVEYQVQFSAPGFLFTTQNFGNDAFDSDADATGKTQIVTLASGENNPTLDAGVYQTASLGDRLWVDTNHDGIQNDGATGIVGATVTLIGGGADGFIDGVNDTTATTITGSDGFYQFTGLTPGIEYQVQFG